MDKFSELLVVGAERDTSAGIAVPNYRLMISGENGKLAVEGSREHKSALEQIQDLMRRTYAATGEEARRMHANLAQGAREPISKLARYKSWTSMFFEDDPRGYGEDNAIPVDEQLGFAAISSTDGRPEMVTLGLTQWLRPIFFEIKSGLRVPWATLKSAQWPVLRRLMERTADDLARKRDAKAKAVLDAQVAVVAGHAVNVSGGLLTKVAIDNIVKTSAEIGFPVTQVAINPSRLMDMTGWTNGSTASLPYFWTTERMGEQVFRQLYADGYANLRWFPTHSLAKNEIYLSGEPSELGYHQHHGGADARSDVDIEEGVDKHVIREDHAYVQLNEYNIWKITITP